MAIATHQPIAFGGLRHAISVVSGVAGERRRAAVASVATIVENPVLYSIDSHRPSLKSFVSGLCRSVKKIAPGARFSFSQAYGAAMAAPEPFANLTLWLAGHLEALHPTIVLDGLERLAETRTEALALIEALARENVARFVLVVDSPEGMPIARWLAEGLCGIPISSGSLPDVGLQNVVVLPLEPRERLLRAVGRGDRDQVRDLLRNDGMKLQNASSLYTATSKLFPVPGTAVTGLGSPNGIGAF